MREALEALEWLKVAFKPGTQGRLVADSAIEALQAVVDPEPLIYEVLDTNGEVIYNSEIINVEDKK
jgi:hypothetical protein